MNIINLQALNNIKIILIQTSHPGNIGSAARAMKTMGLTQLTLVRPKSFPDEKATYMSSHATDILDQAVVVETLEEALEGCDLVLGASARFRSLPWPLITPRQAGDLAVKAANKASVAIIFGNEQAGLSTQELQRCQYHVNIPANPDYSSLNLASSVQVFAYECRMSALGDTPFSQDPVDEPATDKELQHFFAHLEETLRNLNFLKNTCPRKMMQRMRRLYSRVVLEKQEVRLLRGMFSAMTRDKEKS